MRHVAVLLLLVLTSGPVRADDAARGRARAAIERQIEAFRRNDAAAA